MKPLFLHTLMVIQHIQIPACLFLPRRGIYILRSTPLSAQARTPSQNVQRIKAKNKRQKKKQRTNLQHNHLSVRTEIFPRARRASHRLKAVQPINPSKRYVVVEANNSDAPSPNPNQLSDTFQSKTAIVTAFD